MDEQTARYNQLKDKLLCLVMAQEGLLDDLEQANRRISRLTRERDYLLDRLGRYEDEISLAAPLPNLDSAEAGQARLNRLANLPPASAASAAATPAAQPTVPVPAIPSETPAPTAPAAAQPPARPAATESEAKPAHSKEAAGERPPKRRPVLTPPPENGGRPTEPHTSVLEHPLLGAALEAAVPEKALDGDGGSNQPPAKRRPRKEAEA